MTTEGNGNGNEKLVGYTVKELLADLNRKMDVIDSKLDRKADTKDLDALVVRTTASELRTTALEVAIQRMNTNAANIEDLSKRVNSIEVARNTEANYGVELIKEFKDLLKEHTQVKLDINALQTNKKDKDRFSTVWIPVGISVVSLLVNVGLIVVYVIK
jgi:hypothetical protein